jgi:hypothetical protein
LEDGAASIRGFPYATKLRFPTCLIFIQVLFNRRQNDKKLENVHPIHLGQGKAAMLHHQPADRHPTFYDVADGMAEGFEGFFFPFWGVSGTTSSGKKISLAWEIPCKAAL